MDTSITANPGSSHHIRSAGIEGDRAFALFDVETGFGLTARRVPDLLVASARLGDDGGVDITLPDGSVASDNHALSEWLGRRVTLRSADANVTRRYENPGQFRRRGNERMGTVRWSTRRVP